MARILQVSFSANVVRERGSDHYLLPGRKDSSHICLITLTLSLFFFCPKLLVVKLFSLPSLDNSDLSLLLSHAQTDKQAAGYWSNNVSKGNMFFSCAGRRKAKIE